MNLKDIRIHQDPQILIQMVLDRALSHPTGSGITIPIIMINVITSNDGHSKVESQAMMVKDGNVVGDEVLDTWEACRRLKISRPTFLQHVHSGRISASKIGKSWKVFRSELDRFITSSSSSPPLR